MKSETERKRREDYTMALIRKYTKDEAVAQRVLARLGHSLMQPDDPFCEYNILILILLEELQTLRDEQLYSKMLELYRKDLNKVMASMGNTMQRTFGFLIATATIVVVASFGLGYLFAKMLS